MLATFLHAVTAAGLGAPKAYIDPNTGGMLFQVLAVMLAAFSGILFFFSRQIKASLARLRRGMRHDASEEEPPQDPDEKQG